MGCAGASGGWVGLVLVWAAGLQWVGRGDGVGEDRYGSRGVTPHRSCWPPEGRP